MRNHFSAAPPNFKPAGPPETPFQRARQEWDLRIGSAVVQARNWRLAFFVCCLLTTLLAATVLVQTHQSRVIPILVGVDRENGSPTVLGSAETVAYKMGPVEIKYFLAQFIRFVRSVPSDQVVIKQNWLRAYSFLRRDAAGLLNEITNKEVDSPLKKIGRVTVTVQPLSVAQIPETNSYQMRWRETEYSSSGTKTQEYTMLGNFILELEPPKDESTLQENPLGIYITNFEWTREL